MSIKSQPQRQTPPEIIIPPSARRETDFDFDEERVPIHQQLGDISDKVFNFVFSPNTIKFGILLFCAFCIAIDISRKPDACRHRLSMDLRQMALPA